MKTVSFNNEFGSLEIERVTDFMNVRSISYKLPAACKNDFDLLTAEKIALITGNRDIQITFTYPVNGRAYLVLHNSPRSAAICRIVKIDFICPVEPGEMIERLNKGNYLAIV